MDDTCKVTGLSPRQVFAEARFKFVGMTSDAIRQTANSQFDEWVVHDKLPDWVESYCLDRLRDNIFHGRTKAKKMEKPVQELVPSVSGVDDLFENDAA